MAEITISNLVQGILMFIWRENFCANIGNTGTQQIQNREFTLSAVKQDKCCNGYQRNFIAKTSN